MGAETGFIQRLHSQPTEGNVHKISRSVDAHDLLRAVKCHTNGKEVPQNLTKLNERHNVGIGASVWINIR